MGQRNKAGIPRARGDSDAGVQDCVDLMLNGTWLTGKSHVAIAAKHDVHVDTAKRWGVSASRVIRLAIEGDAEDIRARMVAAVDLVLARSMGLEEDRPDGGMTPWTYSAKDALAAIETKAKLLGLMVQKHELAMTSEEAHRLVDEAAALKAAK